MPQQQDPATRSTSSEARAMIANTNKNNTINNNSRSSNKQTSSSSKKTSTSRNNKNSSNNNNTKKNANETNDTKPSKQQDNSNNNSGKRQKASKNGTNTTNSKTNNNAVKTSKDNNNNPNNGAAKGKQTTTTNNNNTRRNIINNNNNNNNTKNNNNNGGRSKIIRGHSSNPYERSKQNTALHHQKIWQDTKFVHCLVAHGDNETIREYFVASASTFVQYDNGRNNVAGVDNINRHSSSTVSSVNVSPALKPTKATTEGISSSSSNNNNNKPLSPPFGAATDNIPIMSLDGSNSTTKQQQQQQQPQTNNNRSPKSSSSKSKTNVSSSSEQQQQQHELINFYVGKKTAISESTRSTRPPFSTKTCLRLCPYQGEHHDLFERAVVPPTRTNPSTSTSRQKNNNNNTNNQDEETNSQQTDVYNEHEEKVSMRSGSMLSSSTQNTDDENDDTSDDNTSNDNDSTTTSSDTTSSSSASDDDDDDEEALHQLKINTPCTYAQNCEFVHADPSKLTKVSKSMFLNTVREVHVAVSSKDRTRLYRIALQDVAEVTAGLLLLCHLLQNDIIMTGALRVCSYYSSSSSSSTNNNTNSSTAQGFCKNGSRCLYAHVNKNDLVRVERTMGDRPIDSTTTLQTIFAMTLPQGVVAAAANRFSQDLGLKTLGDVQCLSNNVFTGVAHSIMQKKKLHHNQHNHHHSAAAGAGASSDPTLIMSAPSSPKRGGGGGGTTASSSSSTSPSTTINQQQQALVPSSGNQLTTVAENGDPSTSFQHQNQSNNNNTLLTHQQKAICILALESIRSLPPTTTPLVSALVTFPNVTQDAAEKFINAFLPSHSLKVLSDLTKLKLKTLIGTAISVTTAACMMAVEALRSRLDAEKDSGGPASIALDKLPPESLHRFLAKTICDFRECHAHHSWRKQDATRPIVTSVITFVNPDECKCAFQIVSNQRAGSNSNSHSQQQHARRSSMESASNHHHHEGSSSLLENTSFGNTTYGNNNDRINNNNNNNNSGPNSRSNSASHAVKQRAILDVARKLEADAAAAAAKLQQQQQKKSGNTPNNNHVDVNNSNLISINNTGSSVGSGMLSNSTNNQSSGNSPPNFSSAGSTQAPPANLPRNMTDPLLSNLRTSSLAFPAEPVTSMNNNSSTNNSYHNSPQPSSTNFVGMEGTNSTVALPPMAVVTPPPPPALPTQLPTTMTNSGGSTRENSMEAQQQNYQQPHHKLFASTTNANSISSSNYVPFSEGKQFSLPAPSGHWCHCKRSYEIGVNYELSTPAGSRCSEQNVMGKLASIGVPTHCIREVFVHGSGVKEDPNPLFPCGVCESMFKRISKDVQEVNQRVGDVTLYMFDQIENPRKLVCMNFHEISHRQGTMFKKFVEEDLRDDEDDDDDDEDDNDNDDKEATGNNMENLGVFY